MSSSNSQGTKTGGKYSISIYISSWTQLIWPLLKEENIYKGLAVEVWAIATKHAASLEFCVVSYSCHPCTNIRLGNTARDDYLPFKSSLTVNVSCFASSMAVEYSLGGCDTPRIVTLILTPVSTNL